MGVWIATELKRLRALKGLSTREMARAVNVPHMTYVSYELGRAVPLPPRRPGLANALGISEQALEDLIEEDQYEVFLRARRLSDEGRAAVRDFLHKVREMEAKDRKKGSP